MNNFKYYRKFVCYFRNLSLILLLVFKTIETNLKSIINLFINQKIKAYEKVIYFVFAYAILH